VVIKIAEPNMITNLSLYVDKSFSNSPSCIYAKQYDTRSRFIKTILKSYKGIIPISRESNIAMLNAKKPDGTSVYLVGDINNDNTITFVLTTNFLAAPGKIECDVVVARSNGEVVNTEEERVSPLDPDSIWLTSSTFTIIVEKTIYDDEAIRSSDDFSSIIAYLAQVPQKAAEAEESARQSSDSAQESSDHAEDSSMFSKISEGWASGTENGDPVEEDSPYYENNSKWYSKKAEEAAEQAVLSESSAIAASNISEEFSRDAEAFSRGTKDGIIDPEFETDNAKYYRDCSKEYSDEAVLAKNETVSAKNDTINAKNDSISAKNDAIDAKNYAESASEDSQRYSEEASDYSLEAESWAVGTRNGNPVPQSDPAYHNNAKYYVDKNPIIDPVTKHWKIFVNGSWIDTGIRSEGIPGLDGTDGTKWTIGNAVDHSGQTTPPGEKIKDLYLNNVSYDIFIWLGATWVLIGNIKGEPGSDASVTFQNIVAALGFVPVAPARVNSIEDKIPQAASINNQLADKSFVNSTVSTNTAHFIGTFNSVEELEAYSGTITNNDYAFVISEDSAGNTKFNRYKYSDANNSWSYEYSLNNSGFTADQWAAINSAINDDLVTSYNQHLSNSDIHVTLTNKNTWNAKYDKPTTGIPKDHLSSDVRDSLRKADTALQSAPVTSVNNKDGDVSLSFDDVGADPLGAADAVNQNLSRHVSNGDVHTSLSEKNKLSGIETGAQVNKLEGVKVNGIDISINNKKVNIEVPTKVSDLDNDSIPEPFIVTVTVVEDSSAPSGFSGNMDHTISEISDAFDEERPIAVHITSAWGNDAWTSIYAYEKDESTIYGSFNWWIYYGADDVHVEWLYGYSGITNSGDDTSVFLEFNATLTPNGLQSILAACSLANSAIQTETDPTVPSWAKNSTKPSYTKSEVGLGNVDNVKQYSSSNPPPYPVTSVNGHVGDISGLVESFPVSVTINPSNMIGTMDHTISEIHEAINNGKSVVITATLMGVGSAVSSSVIYQTTGEYLYGTLEMIAIVDGSWVAGETFLTDDPDHNQMYVNPDPFGVANRYGDDNPPPYPVRSVNNKTGDVVLSYSDVGADQYGAAAAVAGNLNTLSGRVTNIEDKIPSSTSSSNQLADKSFVNSSISTNTAYFIGTFNSLAELEAYSGTVTNNDYAFVKGTDSVGNTEFKRYKYSATSSSWMYEFTLNNSSFTADQWAAINSEITGALVTTYNQHVADTTKHVTANDKNTWNAKYDKPTNGIPRSDLDSATQLSLVHYGTCSTGASTQKKVVTISEITSLTAGTSIRVKFTNAQSYNGAPTLQLNSFDAKSIMRNGETAAARYEWVAGEIVDFVYDGTYWLIANGAIATTTYYGYTKLADSATSTSTATALVPASLYKYSRYAIAGCAVYSASATYAVGDLVLYNFYIYECNTAITTAEAWNANHWTQLDPIFTQVRAKYTKPSGGIPKTDLASAVQTSLGKADTAYQKPSGGIPANDLASGVIPTVPSNVSAFNNDAEYQTLSQVTNAITAAIGNAIGGSY
jgi:hypothetical protein